MSRSRNSNRKAIIQAITSAKNEIIAEIQRAHGNSKSTDFSSIHSPMTMDELVNSIPNDSNQYASKGPMTMNELESQSQNDSPEVILIAGRSRKLLKSRRVKHTRRGKSRKSHRNARK